MSTFTKSGRIAIAESVALRPCHVAWGPGDGAWTTPPAEDINATAVTSEIGRRLCTEVAFLVANPAGDIVVPAGTYSRSTTGSTNIVLFRAQFDFADASSDVIRQLGLVVGCTTNPGLPSGQQYFTPGQIVLPGRLVEINNVNPIFRSPAIRETAQLIVVF
jgi:hypothetical protein